MGHRARSVEAKPLKPWAGRFEKDTARQVEEFTASIHFDRRLYREDIAGSIAHARALAACGAISGAEADALIAGLGEVLQDIKSGDVDFSASDEDIHTAVERMLAAKVGDVAKKLHTGRSRNDQVALDMRLYVRKEAERLAGLIDDVRRALVDVAEANAGVVMPGYTHMQHAQPVLFAHHLLAYFEMLTRDTERLADAARRANVSPLGSGALAGTAYPVDRAAVARELGCSGITRNSIDAVSDRDFVLEFLASAAIIMVHLSRLAEEIVLWSSQEFGFIELDDAFATGSSMMPQKKNPDVAELVRGKVGRVVGDLVAVLTVMKGLPLAYNRDMQEDKESLFDAVDTVASCLEVMAPVVRTMKVNAGAMREAAGRGFTTATDLADYLVRKGVPFREAHAAVGRLVLKCVREGRSFEEITLDEWKALAPGVSEDVLEVVRVEASLEARAVPGGTAPAQVRAALEEARAMLGHRAMLGRRAGSGDAE
ncbi:MAG: argininosuccinate lyase [Bacillota bacterium]|nr:argininosuccinate lyase [Bacillota bacterium]